MDGLSKDLEQNAQEKLAPVFLECFGHIHGHNRGTPVTKKTAYSTGEECLLIICLADNLAMEMIEETADYAPGQTILAEYSVADLSAIHNAHYVLRDRNIVLKLG